MKKLVKICAILVVGYLFIVVIPQGLVRVYNHFTRTQPVALPTRPEVTLTIIPGWNLRQIEQYLILRGVTSTPFLDKVMVAPGVDISLRRSLPADLLTDPDNPAYRILKTKPWSVSYEGYLAPDTYRVFADASVTDVLTKLIAERDDQIGDAMYEMLPALNRAVCGDAGATMRLHTGSTSACSITMHDVLTMASIIEKETRHESDRAMVADILWRRLKKGWALQVDSSVHYAIDKMGDVYTTDKERAVDSLWNTYRYPGLPPGPICNPSLESISAALLPKENGYWYFLSGKDGTMHYAKTLDEHNANKKYL